VCIAFHQHHHLEHLAGGGLHALVHLVSHKLDMLLGGQMPLKLRKVLLQISRNPPDLVLLHNPSGGGGGLLPLHVEPPGELLGLLIAAAEHAEGRGGPSHPGRTMILCKSPSRSN
jgi:hypothetical protein